MNNTALQYFMDKLKRNKQLADLLDDDALEAYKQAEEMHKTQIKEAYDRGEFDQGCNGDAEDYYRQTFESVDVDAVDFIEYTCLEYQFGDHRWIAHNLSRDGELWNSIWIDVIDTTGNGNAVVREVWDSPDWFLGVAQNNPESMRELAYAYPGKEDVVAHFRAFMQVLVNKKWLTA